MIIIKEFFKKRAAFLGMIASVIPLFAWFTIPAERWGGRSWAIGSSVCHQIPSNSLRVGGVQFPVCARCAGMYLGSLIGLLMYALRGKEKGVPKRAFLILLLALLLAWAGDGTNSLLSDLLNQPFLYETSNLSRLATGFGMGLVMSSALATLFNVVIWQDASPQPLLQTGWIPALYAGLATLAGTAMWNASSLLFDILSMLSILTILGVISLLYTVFWVIILKQETRFRNWQMLAPYLAAGLATALAQVMLFNLLRQLVLG